MRPYPTWSDGAKHSFEEGIIAVPDYQSLMLPVLRYSADREVRMPDIADRVAKDFSLTEEEQEELLPSGRQRLLYNRLAWAKFHLSKAGLIDTPSRGRFVASVVGRALLDGNPSKVDVDLLKSFPVYAAFIGKTAGAPSVTGLPIATAAAVSVATPEEQIDAAYSVLHAAVKTDLLQRVLDNTPAFFERVIVELLVAMGYGGSHENAAMRLGKSGDGGIDGVIDEDRLGLDRIYVQAKRYAPDVSVGRPAIQGFVGSLVGVGASKGVFVTTSSFSAHAIEYVKPLQQRIVLIDGERLCELMVEHDVGVRISRTVSVKRVDEDFFADE